MRFIGNLSQAQIAERLGYSQMQISRIQPAALASSAIGCETARRRPGEATPVRA
jgi:DNA-binding transcriptional regulator LsrR (DeoR family)